MKEKKETQKKQKYIYIYDSRIYIYNNSYYSQNFPVEVIERYTKNNDIYFLMRRGSLDKDLIPKKYKLASNERDRFILIKDFNNILNLRDINKEIKEQVQESDGVIVRHPSFLGIPGLYYAKKFNKKTYVEVVGNAKESLYFKGGLFNKIISHPYNYIVRRQVYSADIVSYITKEYLQKCYPTNTEYKYVLPNVYTKDNPGVDNIIKKENYFYKAGIVGSLNVNYKGHNLAIKIINKLNDNGISIKLEIVGGGSIKEYKKRFKELDYTNVIHKGVLKHNEVEEWIKSLDIYFQPSLTEAQGRTIIEAMNLCCPVVATNVGGIPENVPDVCIFDPENWEKGVEITRDILLDDKLRNKLIRNNYIKSLDFLEDKISEERKKSFIKFEEL